MLQASHLPVDDLLLLHGVVFLRVSLQDGRLNVLQVLLLAELDLKAPVVALSWN